MNRGIWDISPGRSSGSTEKAQWKEAFPEKSFWTNTTTMSIIGLNFLNQIGDIREKRRRMYIMDHKRREK